MKILWTCNFILPVVAEHLDVASGFGGGWLTGISEKLLSQKNCELHICMPIPPAAKQEGVIDRIHYHGFRRGVNQEEKFVQYLEKIRPDLIHCMGTEFRHSLDMIHAAQRLNMLDRCVVSIQGLVSFIAEHYYADLPYTVIKSWSFRDLIKHENIFSCKKDFAERGVSEIETLKKAKHIIGRTAWDRACVTHINPAACYHFCNETLRANFYRHMGKWNPQECKKHTILISQAGYPVKGYHKALNAMKYIVASFPDAVLWCAGSNPFTTPWYRRTSYQNYLIKMIKKMNLQNNVKFLGYLNAEEMCKAYLECNVFISASSIENSSNAIGEAMLLGVPVVASGVGGTMDMLMDRKEGYLYPFDEDYMLAWYIESLFREESKAYLMGRAAVESAAVRFDPEKNLAELLDIYYEIINGYKRKHEENSL